ncbi:MAG: hypothetical protein MUC68_10400 [Burkholderiaceae bacterium]|jgi:hypothetical protein|nr:hypothetical protein [Burkholderiaceae bacterium]
MNILGRLRAWDQARRKRAQRRNIRVRLMVAWARLDELRGYVDRDRRHERRERDRLVRQLDEARTRQDELETLLRTYITGQALIDSQQIDSAAKRARESLASGFGELEESGRR